MPLARGDPSGPAKSVVSMRSADRNHLQRRLHDEQSPQWRSAHSLVQQRAPVPTEAARPVSAGSALAAEEEESVARLTDQGVRLVHFPSQVQELTAACTNSVICWAKISG